MKILSPLALCLTTALCASCTSVLKSDYHAPEVGYPISWVQSDMDGNTARLTGKNLTILISIAGFAW